MTLQYEAYLFDLDGTLINSIDLILDCYVETLTKHRGESPTREYFLEGLGITLREQFRVFTSDEDEVQTMVDTYREFNFARHDDVVKPYAGIQEALATLKDQGARVGVVTNKLRYGAGRGLRVAGIEQHVDQLMACDDVENPKPHPEPVTLLLKGLNVAPEAAVLIGDSPIDMQAGRAAGVAIAAAHWGPFEAELLHAEEPEHHLHEVPEILTLRRP